MPQTGSSHKPACPCVLACELMPNRVGKSGGFTDRLAHFSGLDWSANNNNASTRSFRSEMEKKQTRRKSDEANEHITGASGGFASAERAGKARGFPVYRCAGHVSVFGSARALCPLHVHLARRRREEVENGAQPGLFVVQFP